MGKRLEHRSKIVYDAEDGSMKGISVLYGAYNKKQNHGLNNFTKNVND